MLEFFFQKRREGSKSIQFFWKGYMYEKFFQIEGAKR